MKRTYRSKKETGGVIDPRDVVLTLDEKASVFDAFYIQNIKQTKREMSVGASMFAASNKVRKRKYVKRLKDQEPIRDIRQSTPRSAYLTPDKSIRLKRALDPFDLLLNLSTNKVTPEPVIKNLSPLPTLGKGKSYRKKATYKKKFNYSSSDTDSDKENDTSKSHLTLNISDVHSHKLEIEKEEKVVSRNIDQSINNIVNDLSLLDKIQNLGSARPISLAMKDNLSMVKSPLCSTPFHKKYRGKSIYKLSPIYVDDNRHFTVTEKHEDSKRAENKNYENSVQKTTVPSISPNQKSLSINEIDSPILQSRDVIDKNKLKEVEMLKHYHQLSKCKEISLLQISKEEPFLGFSKSSTLSTQNIISEAVIDKYIKLKKITHDHLQKSQSYTDFTINSDIENENNHSSNQEDDNDVILYPARQQLMFMKIPKAKNCLENITEIGINLEDTTDQYTEIEQSYANKSADEAISHTYSEEHSIDEAEHSLNEGNISGPSQLYLEQNSIGVTGCKTYSVDNSVAQNGHSIIEECILESSLVDCPYSKEYSIVENEQSVNDETTSESGKIYSLQNSTGDSEHSLDETSTSNNTIDIESLYESCNSENEISEIETDKKELLVVLERLNNSEFKKYYTKEADLVSTSSETDELLSSEISSNGYTNINKNDTLLESSKTPSDGVSYENELQEDTVMNISNTEQDVTCNYENNKSDEDIFFSFVTRRKRNEITKDSFIFSFENSPTSTSSGGDYDKTVLSNNKCSLDSLKQYNDNTIISDAKINNNEDNNQICDSEYLLPKPSTIVGTDAQTELSHEPTSTINNDLFSKNTVISKNSAVFLPRKSSKFSIDLEEENDMISRNSIVPCRDMVTRKRSNMFKEKNNTKTECHSMVNNMSTSEIKQGIVLEPGKRWERSLSIYRRVTTMGDHLEQSILDKDQVNTKGRKYRQSIINTMEMQDISVSLHNESVRSRSSTLYSKPSRSTIKILRESNASRISLSSTTVSEDLGFLTEDCDDTIIELSKLSIIDSEHEVTVLDKFNDTSNRITTARDYVLRRCNQTEVILFDECYPDTALKNCRKIGEGVYGEVFLWRAGDGRARVLKIVPIAGDTKVNGESQKDYHEIISEIVIAMELSALRAPILDIEKHLDEGQGVETLDLHSVENATDVFNEVLAVHCVQGSYPSRLLDLWELYDECKGSENDNPAVLPADQQFMVLELANAGQDLESFQFHNAEQAYALFEQVAFGLAVAEEAFQFEHRDLHWGNVLIAPSDQKYATFVLRGRAHRVARRGVAATVIDYSLSRLSLRLPSDTAALYNDLAADDGLFDAVGDYQFEVYRLMRDKLGNDWKNFEPYTNILWLHYTVDKMITALRYTRTNTKIHKHYIAKLKEIKNRILDYGSAVQYVLTDNEL